MSALPSNDRVWSPRAGERIKFFKHRYRKKKNFPSLKWWPSDGTGFDMSPVLKFCRTVYQRKRKWNAYWLLASEWVQKFNSFLSHWTLMPCVFSNIYFLSLRRHKQTVEAQGKKLFSSSHGLARQLCSLFPSSFFFLQRIFREFSVLSLSIQTRYLNRRFVLNVLKSNST